MKKIADIDFRTFPNAVSFLRVCGDYLGASEAQNSLMLGLCHSMTTGEMDVKNPFFLAITCGENLVTAAIQTPPNNIILSYSQFDVSMDLATYLKEKGVEFPGVIGPSREAERFAQAWGSLTGKAPKLSLDQKIYELEEVLNAPDIQGTLSLGTMNHLALAIEWSWLFFQESAPNDIHAKAGYNNLAKNLIDKSQLYFWFLQGKPVSMACATRPTEIGISISLVFTPKEFRENGFATALVSRLSQHLLDSGKKKCFLYTNKANPTSNSIYQKIGYKYVCDSMHWVFS